MHTPLASTCTHQVASQTARMSTDRNNRFKFTMFLYHSQTLKLLSSEVVTNLLPLSTNVTVLTAPRCLHYNRQA